MTIKQLLVGTLLGVSAVGIMLHRIPKQQPVPLAKAPAKVPAKAIAKVSAPAKSETRVTRRSSSKNSSSARYSLTKVFE